MSIHAGQDNGVHALARKKTGAAHQQRAALGSAGGDDYAGRLAAARAAIDAGAGVSGSGGGDLSRMRQFGGGVDWANPASIEASASIHTIRTRSVIPATLVSGINSDLPGQIVGQVSQDVYVAPTGKHVLIPQGSRLAREYSSAVQYGQSRVFAVWQRIIFPDGKALNLGSMPGSSGAGYAGFRDRVNNHYFRIFGSAAVTPGDSRRGEMTQEIKKRKRSNQRARPTRSPKPSATSLAASWPRCWQKHEHCAHSGNSSRLPPERDARQGYRI